MSLIFQKKVLENGLTIIGEHNPQAQSFAAGYFVNTGSRDESSDIAGVSHFLEHMMFKGTQRRSAEDINREFDELGANNNAYTNSERTVYYGAVVAERGPELVDLLSDMMRPSLKQDDFDMEKKVILEEIAMYEDRPDFKVFEIANEKFFNKHPLGNSVLGSTESITALTREQMQSYFTSRYAPNNMVLSLAGNYDWDKMLLTVDSLSKTWESQESPRSYPEAKLLKGAESFLDPKLKRSHVAYFAAGVSAQNEDRFAASLLANCIGDGSSSRLYWALIDKGLADSAYLYHDSSDGIGSYSGYLSSAPEQLAEVKAIYSEVLIEVEKEGLSEEEWERSKRKVATSLTLRAETPYGRLMALGSSYLYSKEYMATPELINKLFATKLKTAHELLERKPFSNMYSYSLSPA